MRVPLRVLMVEDVDEDAALNARELQRGGFDVTWRRVETPQAMAAALTQESWDLVLADYAMPRFDSLAALKLVQDGGYDLPFIIVSGTFGEEFAVAAMRAGAHDYVLKDRLDRLVGAVERELREAEGRRARRRDQAALRQSEAITQAVVNTAVDAIVTIDAQGLMQSFNPAAEQLFGYTAAEAIGQNVTLLMPPPYREQHDDYVAAYRRTGVRRIIGIGREVLGRRKDGTTFPMDLAVSEVVLSDRRLFTGIIRDITARKRAEARLALQYATTRVLAAAPSLAEAGPRLLQAIGEAIGWQFGELWQVDPVANLLGWSTCWHPASLDASELVAVSRHTTLAPGKDLAGYVWASGEPAWIPDVTATAAFHRVASAATAGLRGAYAFPIRTDASVLAVMVFFSRVRGEPDPDWLETLDALGRQIGDFIDRKRAEADLRDLQKVAQQRERLADIGAITAQIVHDLGNPLAGVSMQAQLILRRASRDASQPVGSVVKAVESILGEVRRLDSLTKEFMEFSREQRLDLKPLDLRRFLQRIVDLWQPVAAARTIALTFHPPAELPPLTADEEKLHRVFDNLVKNAIEAIDRGPGQVAIHVTQERPQAVRIAVTDSGPGIPETVQVFRLFETTKPEGSGVGLAVARQIVLAHCGSIEFARLVPRGTVFNVDLPCGERSG